MTEQTEAGPQVPPPAGTTRKPTAKEVADQALEGVLALQAKLAELEAQGGTVALADGTPPASLVKAVSDLDRDLSALSEFANQLANRLDHLPTSGVAAPDAEALGPNLEALRTSMNAAVASLRDQDGHLRQELGSLGRAVSTLTERLAELDARPQAAEVGEDAFTTRWNQVARDVEQALTDQRESTQRNLGAITERLDVLADAVTGGQPAALLAGVASRSTELTSTVPKVYGAMVDVMRLVREVGKNGTGPREAGSYGYRKLDDAVDAVGAALREVGLLLVPVEVVSHEIRQTVVPAGEGSRTWTTATVTMKWRYIHPEDGSHQDVVMAGEGRDMGDKATGKANSNAWKNALVQSLNIPVQGMPEVEDEHPVIGAGQGPAQQRPSAPTQPQPPQAGQLTKDEAARRTVQALNNLSAVPPAERRAKLDAIAGYARDQGLTDLVVDGVKVSQVIITVLATLPPAQAYAGPPQAPVDPNSPSSVYTKHAPDAPEPQPQQFPLPTDEPPWDGPQTGVGTEYPHGYQHAGDYS